jgi:hypothetical protein
LNDAITFDDFRPGHIVGENIENCAVDLSECWQRIFGRHAVDGAQGFAESASLAVVLMMRAYLHVVSPRPPGNVQTRHRVALTGFPQSGEAVRTVITCLATELKRGHRYVELEARGSGDAGRAIYCGSMTMIWAA